MPIVSVGQITIVDVNDGVDGLDGPALQIISSAAGFTYQDGVASPADQTIAFTLLRQGLDNTEANWAASGATLETNKDRIDITEYIFGLPGTGDGDTAYLTLAQFGTARQMSIGATVGSLAAYANVSRIGESTAEAGATRNVLSGDWATATAYGVGDIVVKEGFRWVCILAHISSGSIMPPVFPATANTYWRLYGARGAITTSRAIAGSSWLDAEAVTAIADAGGVSPVQGDVVTLFNAAAGYSETRIRSSAGPWTALSVIFGGNVIVDNTLAASKIVAGSITADRIAAGAITASKIAVGDFAVQARNWNFEEGDTQWTKETGWSVVSDAVNAKSGSWVARFTGTSVAALRNLQFVPAEAGEVFYAEAYVRHAAGSSGVGGRVRIQFRDAAGADISFANGNLVAGTTTAYTKSFIQGTAPANTATVRVEVTSQLTAGTAYIDEVRLFRASGTTLIADGAVTTAKIGVGEVKAGNIEAGAVTADKIAAGSITASKIGIGDFENLCPNPSGETGVDGWTSSVVTGPNTGIGGLPATVKSLRTTNRDASIGSSFDVTPGDQFYLSGSFYPAQTGDNPPTADAAVMVRFAEDVSGTNSVWLTSAYASRTTNSWQTVEGNVTVPAGKRFALIMIQIAGTAGSTGSWHFRNIQVRRRNSGALIVDGAISAAKISAGAITTDKLLVTGRGKALNDDPFFLDSSAWAKTSGTGSYALVTESTSPSGTRVLRATDAVQFSSRQFPIVAGTRYKVTMQARRTAGTGTMYLRLYCYNAAGALVNYVATPLSGTGDLENIAVPSSWTKYTGYVDAGSATVNGTLIVHVNWQTTGTTDVADCRVEEYIGADLIVDGAITATKLAANSISVGTAAIENLAITNSMIANTTITDAKISDLSAAKINAGTLDAARIGANSITADKIKVTSKGGLTIISDDPMFQDPTLWSVTSNVVFASGTSAANGKGTTYVTSNTGQDETALSARFYEINPNTVYRLTALIYRSSSSDKNSYLFLEFYDHAFTYVGSGATGWGGTRSGYTFGGVVSPAGEWVRCGNSFGPGTGRAIPANVRYCKIGAWFNYSGNGTAIEQQACQDLRLDEVINGGQLIVDGTISASKIDTRGLDIKDASGNVVFSSGAGSAVSAASGQLRIQYPGGGSLNSDSSSVQGAIWIILPQGWSSTMLRFEVEIYEYTTGSVQTYEVGGYTYTDTVWRNTHATYRGKPGNVRRVIFGYDNPTGRPCIAIGGFAGTWSYPKITIKNLLAGYSNFSESQWSSGWSVSFQTSRGYSEQVAFENPVIGGAFSGLDQITGTNASTYIANAAIGDAQIANTIQSTNFSSSAGWQINKAGTATFNEVALRGAINGGAYTGWAWPASGQSGFHLGPNGLLLGNSNDGKYFQATSVGNIYAPGFEIVNGVGTITDMTITRPTALASGTHYPTSNNIFAYNSGSTGSKGYPGEPAGWDRSAVAFEIDTGYNDPEALTNVRKGAIVGNALVTATTYWYSGTAPGSNLLYRIQAEVSVYSSIDHYTSGTSGSAGGRLYARIYVSLPRNIFSTVYQIRIDAIQWQVVRVK